MATLWGSVTTSTTRTRVDSKGYRTRLAVPRSDLRERFGELPVLSRYVGHLALLLLLAALAWNIVPLRVEKGAGSGSASAGGAAGAVRYSPMRAASVRQEDDALRAAVVPSTTRSLRGIILPVASSRPEPRTSIITYTVQPDDTVLDIAYRFGLQGTSLIYANEALAKNPDLLSIGQELVILPVDGALHKVARGETVESIAKQYKVDPEAITSYGGNALEPPYTLTAGQELIIPGGVKPYVPQVVTYNASSTVTAPSSMRSASGSMVWPMSGYISQGYWEGHRAIDIAAPAGTPIWAADHGYVSTAGWSNSGYGNMVIVTHSNGLQTLYAHMRAVYVEVGQAVSKGQQLGECGSTGRSTGPHVHFEVRRGTTRYNPYNYLP